MLLVSWINWTSLGSDMGCSSSHVSICVSSHYLGLVTWLILTNLFRVILLLWSCCLTGRVFHGSPSRLMRLTPSTFLRPTERTIRAISVLFFDRKTHSAFLNVLAAACLPEMLSTPLVLVLAPINLHGSSKPGSMVHVKKWHDECAERRFWVAGEKQYFFWCPGVAQDLDTWRENIVSCTPVRPQNMPFGGQERYFFMFLCFHKCACGHPLNS